MSQDQQQVDEKVRAILERINVTEPSGMWSTYDVARELDPEARKPRHMFDTGEGTQPRDEFYEMATASLKRIADGQGRYVGGTSGHLYHL